MSVGRIAWDSVVSIQQQLSCAAELLVLASNAAVWPFHLLA